jgi:hypothetical protein
MTTATEAARAAATGVAPEALTDIVLACLHKSRLRRPASAADLERLLMRVRP